MATKLETTDTVVRELQVTVKDKKNEARHVVMELRGDGKIDIRLKGLQKTVTVDPMAFMTTDDAVSVSAEKMTSKTRTFAEHLRGF